MLGCRIDNAPIAQIALAAHQASIGSLEPGELVFNAMDADEINNATLTGKDVIKQFNDIFLGDILYWDQAILDLNENFQDDYKVTFACIVTTIARITLPEPVATLLLKFFCQVFGFDDQKTTFLFYEYDPEVTQLLMPKIAEVSDADKRILLKHGLGVLLKIAYAMFWQEEIFPNPWLGDSHANEIGAFLQPFVNVIADRATGYEHPMRVKTGKDIYPGSSVCRKQEPHSKWHEQAAAGLIDLFYLTDDVNNLLQGGVRGNVDKNEVIGDLIKAIEGFLASDEARCFSEKGQGMQCVAKLWFGDRVRETLEKFDSCRGSGSIAECLSEMTKEAKGFGGKLMRCAVKQKGTMTGGNWDAGGFIECVLTK